MPLTSTSTTFDPEEDREEADPFRSSLTNDGSLKAVHWDTRRGRLPILWLSLAIITVTLAGLLFPHRAVFSSISQLRATSGSLFTQKRCSAEEWSAGSWVLKDPPLHRNTSRVDVLEASGFQGCTSPGAGDWFFGTDGGEMGRYRWDAAQYFWQPPVGGPCDGVERRPEEIVRDLVERGGWLLLGDSLSEQQIFSIQCMLYPHIRQGPDDRGGANKRGWHILLNPDSPLVPSLRLPAGFSFDDTPLVRLIRTDHGFNKPELDSIYASSGLNLTTGAIFTDYPVDSPSFNDYFSVFTEDAFNYRALIISTAPHWTTREFNFPLPGILAFYKVVAKVWVTRASAWLQTEDTRQREILVRASSAGHQYCHTFSAPLKEAPVDRPEEDDVESHNGPWDHPQPFNWGWIPWFNDAFKSAIATAAHRRIQFLPINRPGLLRPDGHSHDCLHVGVGVGIAEGWTTFTATFLAEL